MLTQVQYKLFTGESVSYSSQDWKTLVDIASQRLASLLCLEALPDLEDEKNKPLLLLLANFICASLKFQGSPDTIESKSVRNFTINFNKSATNAFEQIYSQYSDIITKYSNCGTDIKVERNARHCCGFYNNGFINF